MFKYRRFYSSIPPKPWKLPQPKEFFEDLDFQSNKSKPKMGFSFPTPSKGKFSTTQMFEIKLLEMKFKSQKYNHRDIKSYLELFPSNPKIRSKSLALGIDEELYEKYANLFVALVKKNKLESLKISDVQAQLEKQVDIEKCILPEFYQFLLNEAPERTKILDSLINLSNLRSPAAQYEETRKMKRKIILHVGPTNSGKTYSAMQHLKASKSGIYLGPLRLLAHEIYERLNSESIPCNLITGEEKRIDPSIGMYSCTVEMALLHQRFDVAIIDEIQMIGDDFRGSAWTNALLGVQANEVHLCGEASANELIKGLCKLTGDELEIREYKRLSLLHVQNEPVKDFSLVKKGDCVMSFSRKSIFAIKQEIESLTKLKCALIYGNLPPEIRSEQARLFNAKDSGFDVLVASDAIGMGLNLNISRIIFDTVEKFDGLIPPPHAKQIAGRAGRFGTDYAEGYVAAMDYHDVKYLRDCLKSSIIPIEEAGLTPQFSQIEAFHEKLPGQTFSQLLEKFEHLAMVDGNFFLCNLDNHKKIAGLLESLPLSLFDRFIFVLAPVNIKKSGLDVECLLKFAGCRSNRIESHIADVIVMPEEVPKNGDALFKLELIHKSITLYMWLNQRMPDTFVDSDLAKAYKFKAETMIQEALVTMKFKLKKRGQSSKFEY